MSNAAAAALIFPIAYQTAMLSGSDPVLMTYCVIFGASACYMSPFGYQCNLLVYGPGGYKTKDYMSFGTPLQLVLWIFSTLILSLTETVWYWIWIGSAAFFIVVATFSILDLCSSVKKMCCTTQNQRQDYNHIA